MLKLKTINFLNKYSQIGFKSRDVHLAQLQHNPNYDIVIIGGGCNGVGTLMQGAFRNYRCLLLEKDDFGSGTSSKSTKLFHGGVRYLEQAFELSWAPLRDRLEKFKLVKQAIIERGSALKNTSYLSKKIPFVIPCRGIFSTFYYYVGSLFYYLIYLWWTPKDTPIFCRPRIINRVSLQKIFPHLSLKYKYGVIYEDGCFNDARLLMMSLITSSQFKSHNILPHSISNCSQPANFINYAQVKTLLKNSNGQIIGVQFYDKINNKKVSVNSRYVVNCSGPWADTIRKINNQKSPQLMVIVGGAHLTYHQSIGSQQYGLCMPSKDGRVTLVVPWQNRIIVGTTESVFNQPTNNPTVSSKERQFIREAMEDAMDKLSKEDIRKSEISQWCGLRPLVRKENSLDTKSISRDFVIKRQQSGMYSLLGGKWTIYRKMGESIIDQIVKEDAKLGITTKQNSKTLQIQIIGSGCQKLSKQFAEKYGKIGKHLYQSYGQLAKQIIKGDLTPLHENAPITKAEVEWIIHNEMVCNIEDIILRRTRLGFTHQSKVNIILIDKIANIFGEIKKLNKEEVQEIKKKCYQSLQQYQFHI